MDDINVTSNIREYMENKAYYNEIDYGFVKKCYIPWFGKRGQIEPLLDYIDEEYRKVCEENKQMKKQMNSFYIKGPIDADGIPINLNDLVTVYDETEEYQVTSIVYGIDGWMIGTTRDDRALYPPRCIHHDAGYMIGKTFAEILMGVDEYNEKKNK